MIRIPLDEQIDYFKDKAEASKELFFQWLADEYEEIVQSYKVALHREIQHVYRIYGKPLRDDVRTLLIQSLKEIQPRQMNKYLGDKTGCEKIYNLMPKPNYNRILAEVMGEV